MADLKAMSLEDLEAYDLSLAAEKESAYAGVEAVREKQRTVRAEFNRRAVLARFGEMTESEQVALLEALGTNDGGQ